jgi:hypothetical protein
MTERTLELAGLLLSILLLLWFTPSALRALRLYGGVRTRRPVPAGPLEVAPPEEVSLAIADLRRLGFTRIGERTLQLPDGPIRMEWIMSDGPATTYALVVASRVFGYFMSLYSAYYDGTWVQTSYPRGETIDRPDYIARFVETSIEDAVTIQRRELARLRAGHGQPRSIRSMADAMQLDADYRTRHGGLTLRRLTGRAVVPALGAAGLALICGSLLLLGR